ncbi:hypothetical protein SASPL_104277 [Salvia splendens]|uniref:Probable magnesium transporter n=1 Tax=Salvia splendens TaxID=180675 RepID=A0A8X8YN99_SALSN|nr:hypothetical protein SASPL_104277 [Salvia splendens]
MFETNLIGFGLAMGSNVFIGSSFIIKKKGLQRHGFRYHSASCTGEHDISSVDQIWEPATQPAFLLYIASAVVVVLVLVLCCEPHYGQTDIMVYIGVCSIVGSLTVSYEHQSSRYSYKTHAGGLESGHPLPVLDICHGFNFLYIHSIDLPKQDLSRDLLLCAGFGHIQPCHGLSNLLCHVHVAYNICECHNVQGLGR